MLGSRPLSRTTAFAPRRDLKREKPFHQERRALFVASPKHNPKLPTLSISYLSRFPYPCQYRTCPAFRTRFPYFSISYLSRFPYSCQYRTCPAFRVPVPLSVLLSRFPYSLSVLCQYRTCPAFRTPYLSRFPYSLSVLSRFPYLIVPVPLSVPPYLSRFPYPVPPAFRTCPAFRTRTCPAFRTPANHDERFTATFTLAWRDGLSGFRTCLRVGHIALGVSDRRAE